MSQRISNIELIRIVSMLMIVIHHLIYHGLHLFDYLFQQTPMTLMHSSLTPYLLSINSFVIIGVNLFILISGYFHIRLRIRSVVKLYLLCGFYSIITYLYCCHFGETEFKLHTAFAQILLPFSRTKYWFIKDYFILMLLSPMLNKMLKDAIIKTKVMYIILLAVINIWFGFVCGYQIVLTGYNFINFVLLYLIGDLLHSVNLKKYKARTYLYSYLGLSILLAIFSVVIYYAGYTNLLLKCFYYNNPIVLLSSAALFCCFANIKISSKSVNYIAASVLPIYLVQEGGINFYKLVSTYEQGPIMTFIFFGIIFIIISFVIPIAFDKIRIFLFSKMENKLISKLELTTQKIKFFNGEADNS